MVTIEVGMTISADQFKSGQGKNGKWAMAQVKAEKGYDKITLWADNADELDLTASQIIKTINSVKKTARKYEKDGEEKWADEYSANVTLESLDIPTGFAQMDEGCPF